MWCGALPARRGGRGCAAACGRAFTLFELVVVMSLIAVIAAIAMPRYTSAVERYRADSAARRIVTDLARTQSLARAASTSRTIDFRPASNAYVIAAERSLTTSATGSTVNLGDEPYRAVLDSANLGGDGLLTYNGFGLPDSGGTIVLHAGPCQRTVTVDAATGLATIGP